MSVELANFTLSLAIFLSLSISLIAAVGIYQKNPKLMEISFAGQLALLILFVFANFSFLRAFVGLDYSVKEVVLGATLNQPLLHRITAAMVSPKGSLLFLLFLMSLIGHIAIPFLKKLDFFLISRTYIGHSFLIFLFSLYTYFFANPFVRNINLPDDGIGISFTLQNIFSLMIPTALNLGYALGAFLFVFTVSSLFEKNKKEWQEISLVLASCCFITFLVSLFIMTLWSYNNIGWRSWWNWNSIKTSVLMTVLASLSLTLILYVNITKNCLYKYSSVLSLTNFFFISFSLFSLKTNIFASNPFMVYSLTKTSLFLFLSIPITIAIGCFIFTKNFPKETKDIYLVSNQGLAVITAFSFCTIVAILFFAAIYPLFLSFILKTNINYLSDDFYNFSLAPFVGIIVFTAFCFNISKPTLNILTLIKNEKITIIASALLGILFLFLSPHDNLLKTIFFAFAIFLTMLAAITSIQKLYQLHKVKKDPQNHILITFLQTGMILTILSGMLMASYKKDDVLSVYPSKSFSFKNYEITLDNVKPIKNKNYQGTTFNFTVKNIFKVEQKVTSELRFNKKLRQIFHRSGIYRGLFKDIKIYATKPQEDGSIETHLISKPFALWLHIGFAIMILSSILIFKRILLSK